MAKATDPKTAKASTAATDVRIRGFVPKLGDAAHDDGIEAKDLTDLGCRRGIGAVAVRKVLLSQDFVKGLPFDHTISPVRHQILHKKVGNSLANVNIRAEQSRCVGFNGGIVKIE